MDKTDKYTWQLWETYADPFGDVQEYGFIYTDNATKWEHRWKNKKGLIFAKITKNMAQWMCNLLNDNWKDCPFIYTDRVWGREEWEEKKASDG
jgi:hypothetical protein